MHSSSASMSFASSIVASSSSHLLLKKKRVTRSGNATSPKKTTAAKIKRNINSHQQHRGHISLSSSSSSNSSLVTMMKIKSKSIKSARNTKTRGAVLDVDESLPSLETKGTEPFDWHSQWYPIAFECDLEDDAPYAFTLLGTPLVFWKNKKSGAIHQTYLNTNLILCCMGMIGKLMKVECCSEKKQQMHFRRLVQS